MPALSWSQIMRLNVDEVDDELADELFNPLLQFDVGDERDFAKLHKLFFVTRGVMQMKGLQAEVVMEELEQMAHHQGRMSARNEKKLTQQIATLQKELQSRDESGGDLTRLHAELEDLEKTNDALSAELRTKDEEIQKSLDDKDKIIAAFDKQEKETAMLKEELERVYNELDECKNRLGEVEGEAKRSEKKDLQKHVVKVKEQTQQIHRLLDDIKDLETENERLRKQVEELRDKLEDAVQQMEKTTTDYVELKDALQATEEIAESLRKENESLHSEFSELQVRLQAKAETDDEIVATVERRVEEWKAVLTTKEEELGHYHKMVAKLQSQLAASSSDSERKLVETLEKAIQERDDQIRLLSDQLEEATKDLEQSTVMIEEMGSTEASSRVQARLRLDLKEQDVILQRTRQLLLQAEEDAKSKDAELSRVLSQMRHYETGEYGLADAVAEIKECKKQIRLRDSQIEELTQQMNLADALANELSEENESLREKLNLEPHKPDHQKYVTEKQRRKVTNLQLQNQVETLQEEVVSLRHELHTLKKRRKLSLSKSDDQSIAVVSAERDQSRDHNFQLDSENVRLRQDLLGLEEENEDLMEGMKEILIKLQEHDGKSDIVLKCPALEKLVQAVEMQQVTGDYDIVQHLKAQLDILQEQNDVLQTDLKQARKSPIDRRQIQHSDVSVFVKPECRTIGVATQESRPFATTISNNVEKAEEKISTTSSEAASCRRCTALQDEEKMLSSENEMLKKTILGLESSCLEYASCLQRHKELSNHRVESLQKTLEENISSTELEAANRSYVLLASKHGDLLERYNALSSELFLQGEQQTQSSDTNKILVLENRCRDLSKHLQESETSNKELERQLTECVSRELYEVQVKKAPALESEVSSLNLELAQLKSMVEVAHHQAEAIDASREILRTEKNLLQGRILDLMTESDEKLASGKLYREIVALQINEAELKNKLEKSYSDISKHQAQYLLLEQRYSEKEDQLQQSQKQAQNKIGFLTRVLQELRRQFSATVPLHRQEKFIEELVALRAKVKDCGAAGEAADVIRKSDSEARQKLGDVDASDVSSTLPQSSKEIIEDLRQRLREAEETLLDRDQALAHLRSMVPTTAEMPLVDHHQTKQALRVAQSTISCLQARLKQKEQTATHYQDLLSNLRKEVDTQQKKQMEEIQELQIKLQKAQQAAITSATEFASELASRPGFASRNLNSELMAKVSLLEETASLQERRLESLSKNLQESRQEASGWLAEVGKVTTTMQKEKERLESELQSTIRELENENKRQSEELVARAQEIRELRSLEKDDEDTQLLESVEKMRLELESKEEQLKDVKTSLTELRQQMSSVIQESLAVQKSDDDIPSIQKIVDEKTGKLQGQLQSLMSRTAVLQKERDRKDEHIRELVLRVETMKVERDQKEELLERVAREKEDFRKRLARIETSGRLEVERLQKQVRELEEELNQKAEKPFEQDEKTVKSREEVVRWEESKKWQQTVDRLRQRLRDKEQELEMIQKNNKSLREQVIRSGKEKISLENRVKYLSQKVSSNEQPLPVQELKSKVTQLEAELQVVRSSNRDELVEKNIFLLKRIDVLEHELARNNIDRQIAKGMDGHSDLKSKSNELEKQVLKLTEENFELKLELEQLRIDLPRLRIQVRSLEEYIEGRTITENNLRRAEDASEAENNTRNTNRDVYAHPPSKKISPAPTTQMSPSTRRLLDVKTARIVDENNRLQKELLKVKQDLDRSRTKVRQLEQESRKLNDALDSKTREVIQLRKRVPSPHNMEPRQYKAYVVTRMYEDKISGLEESLLQKKDRIEDLERMLNETTLNEERLLVERNHLRDKVDAYENIRLEVGANADEQLRQVRTQLLKVTAEKSELENLIGHEAPQLAKNEQNQYQRLLRETAEIRVDFKTCQLSLQKRVDEIRELKFELDVANRRAKDLETQNAELLQLTERQKVELGKLSHHFGFS